jgi:hypothetical protein
MKKILPFLLFLPLVLFSIYLVFSQFKSKESSKNNVIKPAADSDISQLSQTNTTTPSTLVSEINLVLSSPQSGIEVINSSIQITGTTGKNINVVVNDQDLISNPDGTFSTSVRLDEGENYISVVAYDELGNSAEREIMVIRTISGL